MKKILLYLAALVCIIPNIVFADDNVKPVELNVDQYRVVRVIDGDTIVVQVGEKLEKVRLLGINAPETDECFGSNATEKMRELVDGKLVNLTSDITNENRDKYGRLLRYITLQDGTEVNSQMVALGYARVYEYFSFVYMQAYLKLQNNAQENKLGLWGEDICGNNQGEQIVDVPDIELLEQGELKILDIFFDGVAGHNEPDEYVLIQNVGGRTINLVGYELSDEAGKTYVFGEKIMRPNGRIQVFTGCGLDTESVVFWCSEKVAIWNNTGDTAYLVDLDGFLIDKYSYDNIENQPAAYNPQDGFVKKLYPNPVLKNQYRSNGFFEFIR